MICKNNNGFAMIKKNKVIDCFNEKQVLKITNYLNVLNI